MVPDISSSHKSRVGNIFKTDRMCSVILNIHPISMEQAYNNIMNVSCWLQALQKESRRWQSYGRNRSKFQAFNSLGFALSTHATLATSWPVMLTSLTHPLLSVVSADPRICLTQLKMYSFVLQMYCLSFPTKSSWSVT